MKNLAWLVIPLILSHSFAYAGEDETTVKNTAEKAFESNLTNSALKEVIDCSVQAVQQGSFVAVNMTVDAGTQTAAGIASSSSEKTVGDDVVTIYGIYQGLSDFSKAKNDEQKGFDAAEVTANILTLIPPTAPVGAMASLVVPVVQLAVQVSDMRSARRIAEINARTAEIYKQIADRENKIAQGEIDTFKFVQQSLNYLLGAEQSAATDLTNDQCTNLNEQSDLNSVRICLGHTETLLKIRETEYGFLIGFINTPFIQTDLWTRLAGKNSNFRSNLRDLVQTMNSQIQKTLSAQDQLKTLFANITTDQFIQNLQQDLMPTEVESALNHCTSELEDFVLNAVTVMLRETTQSSSSISPMQRSLNNIDTLLFLQQGDELASECGGLDQKVTLDKNKTSFEKIALTPYSDAKNKFQKFLKSLHQLHNG